MSPITSFIPSTRVTILRGVLLPNTFGDELPAMAPIATGVPADVVDAWTPSGSPTNSQLTYQPTGDRAGVVEQFTIRLRPGTDVTEDDQIADERTGAVYQVRNVYNPQSFVGLADVRCTAVRTGAASLPVNG